MNNPPPFAASLIVVTRDRLECLRPRVPKWVAAGFDEVIVVDGSPDLQKRRKIEEFCRQAGATYVAAPAWVRDTRSLSRNLGAKSARSPWILFQDDDDDVPLKIDKGALERASQGKDWLAGPKGEIIVWHRRESFLSFGGYPEDMVAAEDWVMSNRARARGIGGPEPSWFEGSVSFPPPREDPIGRVRNSFWYGYTLLLFLVRCPLRSDVIVGDSRRLAKTLMSRPVQVRRWVYFLIGVFGRVLSPIHCLLTWSRSGANALRQEPYRGWQGLREPRAPPDIK